MRPMTTTSWSAGGSKPSWRRELAPVIAVAGLAADYLSPEALWTILLPIGALAALLAMRKWALAAVVFSLSSWVLIPTAATVVSDFEESAGERRLYSIPGTELVSTAEAAADPCVPVGVDTQVLPLGPGHVINPRWALRRAIVTFADTHNALVIDRWHRSDTRACVMRHQDSNP